MEQFNLFGEPIREKKKRAAETYEEFTEKFKPKLTTDDCYTPAEVYETVRDYFLEIFPDWQGRQIVRPFYPGGNYQTFEYPDGCVVIDNPPFSIYSQIVRWYLEHGIEFLLFGPALTLLVMNTDITYFVTDADIVYENGAVVRTGFITNHPHRCRVLTCPDLTRRIKHAQKSLKKTAVTPKITLDPHITTSALLLRIAAQGIVVEIDKNEAMYLRKSGGRALFGGGLLLSDEARRKADEARRKADEARRKADEARRKADEARAIQLPLSATELALLDRLNNNFID